MQDSTRLYHIEMLLSGLHKLQVPYEGGTRNYLDIDITEKTILIQLLGREWAKLKLAA